VLYGAASGSGSAVGLDIAYRDAVMSLGERELVTNQGFTHLGTSGTRGGGRRREYSRIRGGRAERYAFIEDPATGSITVDVLGLTAANDVKTGAECPPSPDFLASLLGTGVREIPYQGGRGGPQGPLSGGPGQTAKSPSAQKTNTHGAR
jgi:hypothetical protein